MLVFVNSAYCEEKNIILFCSEWHCFGQIFFFNFSNFEEIELSERMGKGPIGLWFHCQAPRKKAGANSHLGVSTVCADMCAKSHQSCLTFCDSVACQDPLSMGF